jgi:hypothetical protein
MTELTADERKELERLRAERKERQRAEQGIEQGFIECVTPGCPEGRKQVDLVKSVSERKDSETGLVENSFTYWHYEGDKVCSQCDMPLTVIEPNARSAFPQGYRFQYGEPVR